MLLLCTVALACPPSSGHTCSLFLPFCLEQGPPCAICEHLCWWSSSALPEEGNNGNSHSALLDTTAALNAVATLDAAAREIQAEADWEIC